MWNKNTADKFLLLLFFTIVCGVHISHAQTGGIRGVITDASSGETLIGANVVLQNTAIGDATNLEGQYHLRRLPEGEQTIVIRSLGYRTQIITVNIQADETLVHDIVMDPDVMEGEEILIYSQALGQAQAIRTQLASNTIVNVVSEARLRELPDANAAETIGRLPGVSIIRDAGEGSKVAIRGMGPQYSSITIDGNRIPGTSADRSVDLSMISPEMLSGIEVYKSIRPDMDADAIGGTVNFKMGGAPSEARYRMVLEGGYSSHISDIGTYKASFLASNRFLENRLGVMASLNASQVDRSSHVHGASYTILRDRREGEPHAPVEVSGLTLTDRLETRQRYGGGLSLDWRLPNGRIFFNNVYSRQNRDGVSLRRQYTLSSNTWTVGQSQSELYTLNNSLSGQHEFRLFEVDWRLSRSASSNKSPYNHSGRFVEPSSMEREGVDLSGGPEVIPGMYRDRPETAYLTHLENQIRGQKQQDLTASLDIQVPVNIGRSVSGYVKTGGKHYNQFRERTSDGYRIFDHMVPDLVRSGGSFPWETTPGGRAKMTPFIADDFQPYNILDGQYEMQHMPSIHNVNLMFDEYSHEYRWQLSTRFDDYEATERLSAGYLMTELNIGTRIMILPGFRYEYEHSDYTAKIVNFTVKEDELGRDPEEDAQRYLHDTTATRNMGMLFPMVQTRIRLTDWFDIRIARTETASRPSFSDISPKLEISHDRAHVRRGDTQLRPMRSTNYDLFFTFHHNRIGLFTIGGFYKDVEDLIYTRNANMFDPVSKGFSEDLRLYSIREPVNNKLQTTVHGFEVEWQSNLTHLRRPFNGLVLNANYSRFFSESHYHSFEIRRGPEGFVGVDTFRVAPMVHQADHIANVSLGYDYRGFSTRVSMQYQGATLRSVGQRPEQDLFTDAYLRFDAVIRQRVIRNMANLFLNLHNLTNREDRSSQFTYDRPRNLEYYGASFDVGIEFRF
jgi:TonB-dependent receptor